MHEEVYRLSSHCLAHANCYGSLQSEIRSAAQRMLPPDALERVNAHGNTHIAVTYPAPRGDAPARRELVKQWTDREDLVKVFETTIYIPFYAGTRLSTT